MRTTHRCFGAASVSLISALVACAPPGDHEDGGTILDPNVRRDGASSHADGATRSDVAIDPGSDVTVPGVDGGPPTHDAVSPGQDATAPTTDASTMTGTGPTLSGCPMFPADNAWNRDVSHDAVDSNSQAYITSIGASTGLHADFGTNPEYGIPYVVVPATQARVPMTFDYMDESDPGPYPFPASAPIEGGPSADGDRHVLVLDQSSCLLYETWDSHPLSGGASWRCGSGAIWHLRENWTRPSGWTSADAAGLPVLPGLVRYDEIAAGAIRHAIRFTVVHSQNGWIAPASHAASSSTNTSYPPMGLRLRLKASVDISHYGPHLQIILRAFQTYGLIVADNGSNWYISGTSDPRWDDDELHAIGQVHGSDFEVIHSGTIQH